MELIIGVLFIGAMIVAAKGVKAPESREHALAMRRGEAEDTPRGNFLVAMLLLGAVAVIGIAMLGGNTEQGGTPTATHNDTWSHNQINIASDVRNVVIGGN